jgi:dolichol-phosphate mannosyltransferase
MGADCILEMDADFSHQPRYIPDMLQEIEEYDVIIGSRAIEGGAEIGRSLLRILITKLANAYIRWLLGLTVKDCTSGFRCFRREVLESIPWSSLRSQGPSIVEEILYYCHQLGFRIKEVPIIFEDRKRGKSTLTLGKLLQTYIMLHRLKFRAHLLSEPHNFL